MTAYPNSGLIFFNNFTIGSGGGDGGEIRNAATRYVSLGNDIYYGPVTLNGSLIVLVKSYNNNNFGLTPKTTFNGAISGTNSAYGVTCNGTAVQVSNVISVIVFNATNNYP